MKVSTENIKEILLLVSLVIGILLLDRTSKKKYQKLNESTHSNKE